ncbi:hypothetical protein X793_03795 [Dehalococcoides mccartyi CG4]|nr:hypothetical protein X793_03795 [Dehalococcoides mccartyi CG4]
MKEKALKEFTVKLDNGKTVNVTWHINYFAHADHLELRGCMTSTGYRSEFINKAEGDELDPELVMEHARRVAQECWEANEQKHGVQATMF